MRKKLKNVALEVVSKLAWGTAKSEVNSACTGLAYQPQIPSKAKALRKF